MSDTIRVTGPAGALRNIPGLVGFIPTDSLVLLFMGERGQVTCTIRIDLDDALADPDRLLSLVPSTARQAQAIRLLPSLWCERMPTENDLAGLMVALTMIDTLHVTVYDLLWTNGVDAYSSYSCDDPTCCPRVIDYGASEIELTKGETAARSRDALVRSLSPRVSPETGFGHVDPDPVALFTELQASAQDESIVDESLALLFRATTRYSTWSRDTFIVLFAKAMVHDGMPGLDGARLERLAQSIPDGEDKALGVLTALAFMAGNGAASRILAQRCPDDSLAGLVTAALDMGSSPRFLIDTFAVISQARIDESDPTGRI